jgi:hypothetical protein
MTSLFDLPFDIYPQIFLSLSPFDLVSFSLVSKSTFQMTNIDDIWRRLYFIWFQTADIADHNISHEEDSLTHLPHLTPHLYPHIPPHLTHPQHTVSFPHLHCCLWKKRFIESLRVEMRWHHRRYLLRHFTDRKGRTSPYNNWVTCTR